MTLYSPITGTVIEKMIVENSAFKAGDVLYRIANLDTRVGLPRHLRVRSRLGPLRADGGAHHRGVSGAGRSPAWSPSWSRCSTSRPGRSASRSTSRTSDHAQTGNVRERGHQGGARAGRQAAPTGVEGKFTCPMHPQVMKDGAGRLPDVRHAAGADTGRRRARATHGDGARTPPAERYVCPMKCEGDEAYDAAGRCPVCRHEARAGSPRRPRRTRGASEACSPYRSAPFSTAARGRSSTSKRGAARSSRARSRSAPAAATYFPVLKGLAEGERVVTRGGFLIDSQFQITGHPSLYYPGGLHAAMGHQHGGTGNRRRPQTACDTTGAR